MKLSPAQVRRLSELNRCNYNFNARTFCGKSYFVLERLGLITVIYSEDGGGGIASITAAGRQKITSLEQESHGTLGPTEVR